MKKEKSIPKTKPAADPKIYCAYTKLVPTKKIKPNPRNPNHHPQRQLDLLEKIIRGQGWRSPITISKRSGFIVRGHGRYMAALQAGIKLCPVDFQNYKSEREEMADLLADNRISEFSEVNLDEIRVILKDLNQADFDLALTGYDDIKIDIESDVSKALDVKVGDVTEADMDAARDRLAGPAAATYEPEKIICPHCGEEFAFEKK